MAADRRFLVEGLGNRGRIMTHAFLALDYINREKVLTCVVRRQCVVRHDSCGFVRKKRRFYR